MTRITETATQADPKLPVIRLTRDFAATPGQRHRAHTDPVLFERWAGPDAMQTRIEHWDARTGGSWKLISADREVEYAFRGCLHEIRPFRIVQAFSFEGEPDGVALETRRFQDLGDGRTRPRTHSLVDSFEARHDWLASGMQTRVNDGYA
jgi:uncharacterized protein YndB with AHSA1/START domain